MTDAGPHRYAGYVGDFARAGRMLSAEGLVSFTAGNLSVALPEQYGGGILITRSGAPLGVIEGPDDLVVAGLDGPAAGASRELPVHQAIYRAVPGCKAIVHAHPVTGTALSIDGPVEISFPDIEGDYILGTVPVVEDTAGLVEALRTRKVVMLRAHGCFAAGGSLIEAYAHVSTFEHSCRIKKIHMEQLAISDLLKLLSARNG